MEDAIQLEGEFERRDEDVEFGIDGVGVVEGKDEAWEKERELGLKPAFEFRDTSALGFMGVVPFGGT